MKTILLPASTPLSYAVVAPLWVRLAADARIELMVSARHGGRELAEQCLDRPVRYVHRAFARFAKADLALCPGFHYRHGRARLRVQMFHGVSFKNYAVSDDVLAFQRWMVIGEYHRRKLVKAGLAREDDPRVLRVGMPKTDALLGPRTAGMELLARLGLDASLPTVAYAPTRSGSAGSSLEGFGLEAIDLLATLPVNVLVKLHDRSDRRFRAKLTRDYAAEIEARHRTGRVRIVRAHDVVPVLQAADVLVSDLSSVANEFLLRDAPVLYLSTPEHEAKIKSSAQRRFGDDDDASFDWMRAAGDVVPSAEALVPAVERALAHPRERSAERKERARLLFYNPGRATEVALAELYRLLELAPP
ncbi:MAG: CDP-glycerol glycerophosphotransferase family protein [Planctomycetes bacterium]|nr:CDP-glycerol glycerophosphotransferase family protein [Planctomycetota bacterium]MCC7171855.1 CDP-glycerol glycerophosphotransferase family protein [Planctomycetota bacterium]